MLAVSLIPRYEMEWDYQGNGKVFCSHINLAGGMEMFSAIDLGGLIFRPEI